MLHTPVFEKELSTQDFLKNLDPCSDSHCACKIDANSGSGIADESDAFSHLEDEYFQ